MPRLIRFPFRRLPALALGLALLLAPLLAWADADASPEHTPPVPLLWKVQHADRSLYLLGSFHLLTPQDYPLSEDMRAVQAKADKLVMELSPEEMASPELATKMAQAAMARDGRTLSSKLPAATRTRLDAWVKANKTTLLQAQIPPQVLEVFEPWFVGLTISLMQMQAYGLNPELGLDKHLGEAATAAGLPTAGLETGDQQIALLAGMSPEEQLQFLDEALDDADAGEESVAQLHRLWRAGDAQGLWQEMALPMREEWPALYQRINVERNDAWVPKLEALLADEAHRTTLVVVGSLHLLGEDGVVEKLRARGYQVERICSACVELRAVP